MIPLACALALVTAGLLSNPGLPSHDSRYVRFGDPVLGGELFQRDPASDIPRAYFVSVVQRDFGYAAAPNPNTGGVSGRFITPTQITDDSPDGRLVQIEHSAEFGGRIPAGGIELAYSAGGLYSQPAPATAPGILGWG